MQTVCEPNPIASAVKKLDAQHAEARQNYRLLVARVANGGGVAEGDALVLLMAGKTSDDFRGDVESQTAAAADLPAAEQARKIRSVLLPAARQQAAAVAKQTQEIFGVTRTFFAEFLRELDANRVAAENRVPYLEGFSRELARGPNSEAVRVRREREKAMIDERRGRQPLLETDPAAEAGRRCLAGAAEDELQRLSEPCQPLPVPAVQEIQVKDLAAIVAVAVGPLCDAQRHVMRDIARALTATLQEAQT
jgi:hypothetical protein